MKNYDWKELKRIEHKPQLIMGGLFPDSSILKKAIGASVYLVTYHLCNGVPSGSGRFGTRWEAEEALAQTIGETPAVRE